MLCIDGVCVCLVVMFGFLQNCCSAVTFAGLVWSTGVNLKLLLLCFSVSHISVIVVSDQFILGFPTLLIACVVFQISSFKGNLMEVTVRLCYCLAD